MINSLMNGLVELGVISEVQQPVEISRLLHPMCATGFASAESLEMPISLNTGQASGTLFNGLLEREPPV
jgi:hypothetical protein